MMNADTSNEWSTSSVLKRLAKSATGDEAVSAQIVLSETVLPDAIASTTLSSLAVAARTLGLDPKLIRVGAAQQLAHSISVEAPVSVLRTIMSQEPFSQIMPGNLSTDEVMIKPVGRTRSTSSD
jgi:hypothetical protein